MERFRNKAKRNKKKLSDREKKYKRKGEEERRRVNILIERSLLFFSKGN